MGILVCLLLGAYEVGSLQGSCFPQLSGGFEEPLLMDMGSWWLGLQLGRIRGDRHVLGVKGGEVCDCPTLEGNCPPRLAFGDTGGLCSPSSC